MPSAPSSPSHSGDDTKPVRVDAWLWATRLTKTRSAAADACRGGHVKVDGVAAKPATQVSPGTRVRIWINHRQRDVEVRRTLSKRVSAAIAVTCYIDHSPPLPPKEVLASVAVRERGAGRPTKRERRQLDRLRGRSPH